MIDASLEKRGVAVITLKFGKATHAKDYIFATDEEQRKAWGELQPRLIANRRMKANYLKPPFHASI